MNVSILILLVFVSLSNAQEACSPQESLLRFKEVVNSHYLWRYRLKDFNPESLEGALKILRSMGDRWSTITKEEEDRSWYRQSRMVGLGIRWDERGMITKVFIGSPAQRAGLKRGDRILSVQGVKDISLWSQTVRRLPLGSEVEVYVLRDESILRFEVIKGEFEVPMVDEAHTFVFQDKLYGYVALNNFTQPAGKAFREVIESFVSQGVDHLIIDLRYNGGGLLSVAKEIADIFIKGEGVMFYLEGVDGKVSLYRMKEGRPLYDGEITLLVSRNTASASELLAVLLKYYRNAHIIGDFTLGKYVGSNMYKLNDCGDVLRLITFEMKLPDGYAITGDAGILPDCLVRNSAIYSPEALLNMCNATDLRHVANSP